MGGVIKKIASIAKPFVAMIPGVGPLIAKAIDIVTQAIDQFRALRQEMKLRKESTEKKDKSNSNLSGPGDDTKKQAETTLQTLQNSPQTPGKAPDKSRLQGVLLNRDQLVATSDTKA